jgi:hypothetical protein
LYSQKLISKKTNGKSKVSRFIVIKTINPETEMESTVGTDFSKENWGTETTQYLKGIKGLPKGRFDKILNAAQRLSRKAGKFEEPEGPAVEGQQKSFRESLLSDGENNSEDEEEARSNGGTEVSLGFINYRLQ